MAISYLNKVPYLFCRTLAALLFRSLCKISVVCLDQYPSKDAYIVACNHISHFDPPLISILFQRILHWIAMEELFHYSWSKHFFTSLLAIPVDRFGIDVKKNHRSLRSILKQLSHGEVVGIFPEGGIRSGNASILEGAPMKPALATISLLSQAPIIPCVLLGSDRLYSFSTWFHRPHLWFIIGEKMFPPAKKAPEEERLAFQEKLNTIFQELQTELCNRFDLKADDLPQTAQMRKGDK